jgi:uncharacterized phage infection (PIP) family protein YhgE
VSKLAEEMKKAKAPGANVEKFTQDDVAKGMKEAAESAKTLASETRAVSDQFADLKTVLADVNKGIAALAPTADNSADSEKQLAKQVAAVTNAFRNSGGTIEGYAAALRYKLRGKPLTAPETLLRSRPKVWNYSSVLKSKWARA